MDSIDKIAEDDELVNSRNSPVNENPVDVYMTSSGSPTRSTQTKNPFLNGGGKAEPFSLTNGNGYRETQFEQSVGREVSRGILEEVIDNIGVATPTTAEETQYDDSKNPFMEEFYDESLSAA